MDIVHLQTAALSTGGEANCELWVSADYVTGFTDYNIQRNKSSVANATLMAPEAGTKAWIS